MLEPVLFASQYVSSLFQVLNESKFFWALMMLGLQIGGRFVEVELSQVQRKFLSGPFFKALLIFTMCFMPTKDVAIALTVSGLYILFVSGLFHEESQISILPEHLKSYDQNNDNKLSPKEIKDAYHKLVREGKIN